MSKTLRLIGKRDKKNYVTDPNERVQNPHQTVHKQQSAPNMLLRSGSADDMLYGKSWLDSATDWLKGKTDEAKTRDLSKFFASTEDEDQATTMNGYITQIKDQLSLYPEEDEFFDDGMDDDYWDGDFGDGGADGGDIPEGDSSTGGEMTEGDPASFDPRLTRFDAVKTEQGIIPFATDTASSVFYDMTFHIERSAKEAMAGSSTTEEAKAEGNAKPTDIALGNVDALKDDPDMYGVQSLVNPYCVTRLVGGLGKTGDKFQSYMYDVRD